MSMTRSAPSERARAARIPAAQESDDAKRQVQRLADLSASHAAVRPGNALTARDGLSPRIEIPVKKSA